MLQLLQECFSHADAAVGVPTQVDSLKQQAAHCQDKGVGHELHSAGLLAAHCNKLVWHLQGGSSSSRSVHSL